MMSEPVLREAKESDIGELLEMMAAFYRIGQYDFDVNLWRKNLLVFIHDAALGRIWMIELGAETAGYVILSFGFSFEHGGRDAFIDELFLKEKFRSKGYGRVIMKEVENKARLNEVKVLHLEVEKDNTAGIKLYRRGGFRSNERMLMSKKINGVD